MSRSVHSAMDWMNPLRWGTPWREMRVADLYARGILAEHVRVGAMSLACEPDDDAYRLRLTCTLTADRPNDRHPIGIDCTASVFEFVDAACDAAGTIDRLPQDAGEPPLVVLSLRPGHSWHNATLQLTLRWKGAPYLLLPDMLPPPLRGPRLDTLNASASRVSRPRLILDRALPDELRSASVQRAADGILQLVVIRRPAESALDAGLLTVIGDGLTELSPARRREITGWAPKMLAMLDTSCGVAFAGRAVAVLASEFPGGVPAPVFSALFHVKPAQSDQQSTWIRNLAGMWWGAGCRVAGKGGAELCLALGSAMGLSWLSQRGEVGRLDKLSRTYMQRAGSDAAGRNASAIDPPSAWPALTLSLFAQLKNGAEAKRGLQQLTSDNWGTIVGAATVVRALRAMGVDVPRAFD